MHRILKHPVLYRGSFVFLLCFFGGISIEIRLYLLEVGCICLIKSFRREILDYERIMCIVRELEGSELEILLQFDEMLSRNICTVAGTDYIIFYFLPFPHHFFVPFFALLLL